MDFTNFTEFCSNALKANLPIYIFLAVVGFDIITGYFKSKYWGVTDSSVGKKGLSKHIVVVSGVCVFYLFAQLMGLGVAGVGAVTFYTLNYVISIMENLGVMGIPYPKFLEVRVKSELAEYEKAKEQITNKEV